MDARSLPLRHRVGQLFVIGFHGTEPTPALHRMLRGIQPAGTILFKRNIATARQTHALNAAIHESLHIPPFLCLDLEGGTVDRLRDAVAHMPDAASVALTGDKKQFRRHGELIGRESRALGFNVDFAPVLDIGYEASRPVLTSRAAGSDPAKVVAFAREFLSGLSKTGVLGCGKHFPGLGEGALDTHKTQTVIRKQLKEMWREDLLPYRELRSTLPMVMVSHAGYPEITGDETPASLSPKLMRSVLRRKIGYRGLVISDDMEMGASVAQGPIEEIAVEGLRAGLDLLAICRDEDLIWRAYEAVLCAAESERRFAAQVTLSCERVLALKQKTKSLRTIPPGPTDAAIEKLRDDVRSFRHEIIGELPL